MQRFKKNPQGVPPQGGGYPPGFGPPPPPQPRPMGQPPPPPPPMQMQQPYRQFAPPPIQQPIPQYPSPPMQQPGPQFAPPPMQQQQQQQMPYGYGPNYSYGGMSSYPSAPSLSYLSDPNQMFYQAARLSNATGLSTDQIERLRREFSTYANPFGVIDRKGFRKLYVASLVNMTWDDIERNAETAFRNFDTNLTGGVDFEEYVTSCARMSGGNPAGFNYQQNPY